MDVGEYRRTIRWSMDFKRNKKGDIFMVFDESYQSNLDENRGAEAWGILCTDTDRYTQGYLPTTSQVENSYIS